MESNQTRAKRIKRDHNKVVVLSSGKNRNFYFTQEIQEFVNEYNRQEDELQRNRIFNKIVPALNKIAHNLIFKYKLQTDDVSFSDLRDETVTHLFLKLEGYDDTKGTAFSYLSAIAFNFLYGKKQKFIKSNHITYEIDTLDVPHVIDIEIYDRLNNLDDELLANDKIKSFVDYFSETIKIHFSKEDDFLIANAFLEILKNSDSINFSTNQKSIYFLVKEQTGCRQSDILRILKRIRRIYGRVIFETDNK